MKERIKQLMQREHLTLTQFSEKIGVHKSRLSHILSGRNQPNVEFLQNISMAMPKLSLKWLLNGEGAPFSYPETTTNTSNALLFNTNDKEPVKKEDIQPPVVKKQEPKPFLNSEGSSPIESDTIVNQISSNESDKCELKEIIKVFTNGTFEIIRPMHSNK